MLVALTSEAHGSHDIGHASALRDQGGMPVDETFQTFDDAALQVF